MSQTNKIPVLKVRNKVPGISTGANTIVELDGVPLKTLSFLKLEFNSRKTTKVTMEMYVDVDVEIVPEEIAGVMKKTSGTCYVLSANDKVKFCNCKK